MRIAIIVLALLLVIGGVGATVWQLGLLSGGESPAEEDPSLGGVRGSYMLEVTMLEDGAKRAIIRRVKRPVYCDMDADTVGNKPGLACKMEIHGTNPKLNRIAVDKTGNRSLKPVPYKINLYLGLPEDSNMMLVRVELPDPWAPTASNTRPTLKGHGGEYNASVKAMADGVSFPFSSVGYSFNPDYSGMRSYGRPSPGRIHIKLLPVSEELHEKMESAEKDENH